jgi:hypothetical protein
MRSSSLGEDSLRCSFCFTDLPDATILNLKHEQRELLTSLFQKLWSNPISDPGSSPLLYSRLMELVKSDPVLGQRTKLRDKVELLDLSLPHIDYVPAMAMRPLQELVRSHLKSLAVRWAYGENVPTDVDAGTTPDGCPQLPLSVHTLWLKAAIGTCLSCAEAEVELQLELFSEHIVPIFLRIKSAASSLCKDSEEFQYIFSDLLQILRVLGEISSARLSVHIPNSILKSLSSFEKVCEGLLSAFAGGKGNEDEQLAWDVNDDHGSEANSESEDSYEQPATEKDLLDDSDDDEIVNKKRVARRKGGGKMKKRKVNKRSHQRQGPHMRSRPHNPAPPDSLCASIIGSILITLEPSISRCEFVVDCLLVQEQEDNEVDLGLAYQCLILLSDKTVMFHDNAIRQLIETSSVADESFRHQSPVTVLCRVLDQLRASAGPSSVLHMFGFQLCAECVRLGEDDMRGAPLTAEESKALVSHLTFDNASTELRPYLRADQLKGATAAFVSGQDNFHAQIDSIFPKTFVIPSLQDISSIVRRDACLAVAAALRILPDPDKVIKGVLSRMPPIAFPSKGSEDHRYQEWYQHRELGSGDFELENKVWEDALISMESGAILCRGVIAGQSLENADSLVYGLIRISAMRPQLEALCFHACDKGCSRARVCWR